MPAIAEPFLFEHGNRVAILFSWASTTASPQDVLSCDVTAELCLQRESYGLDSLAACSFAVSRSSANR